MRRGIHSSRCAEVTAFVHTNPGCSGTDINERFPNLSTGLLTYCVSRGILFLSGRRRFYRYYASADMASANDARHKADAAAHIASRVERTAIQEQLRRRARRHDSGVKPINTRPSETRLRIDPGVSISPVVKFTACPSGRDTRYTVTTVAEPLFSTLGLGRYLKRDTAIQRAYGGGK